MGAPKFSSSLLSAIAPDLPLTIIVLILEHIAISKSFGRINNYTINPSQELVAVGKLYAVCFMIGLSNARKQALPMCSVRS